MILTDLKLFKTGSGENVSIWYYGLNPSCDVCKANIFDTNAVFIIDWHKKGKIENLMHSSCVVKYVKHPLSVTQNRFHVLLTEIIPPGSIPLFVQSPSIKDSRSGVTVFEPDKIDSARTTDNADKSKRYASLEGATVGAPLIDDGEELSLMGLVEAEKEKKLLK